MSIGALRRTVYSWESRRPLHMWGCARGQGCVHNQQKPQELTLPLEPLHKQEMKVIEEFSTTWPSVEVVPQHTY